MQNSGDTAPAWFAYLVVDLFAGYPQASMSSATVRAYWRKLSDLPRAAVEPAFDKASRQSAQWCPSAELVREVAAAIAKTISGPKPDYSRPALPEHEPELPEGHPMRAQVDQIQADMRSGKISGEDVMKAFVGAVLGRGGDRES